MKKGRKQASEAIRKEEIDTMVKNKRSRVSAATKEQSIDNMTADTDKEHNQKAQWADETKKGTMRTRKAKEANEKSVPKEEVIKPQSVPKKPKKGANKSEADHKLVSESKKEEDAKLGNYW